MCLKDIVDARRFGSRTTYVVSNDTGAILIGASLSRIRLIFGASIGTFYVAPSSALLAAGQGFLIPGYSNLAAHPPSATGQGVFRIEDWGRAVQGNWYYTDVSGLGGTISVHEVFLDDGWPQETI